ncbi:hypothetical protein FND36_05040 [Lachnospiraceae bacterium KGMB03038]|nr:hypothetical protein FND36_05040 [Lachnospiraceae bacterium KGMB03038]
MATKKATSEAKKAGTVNTSSAKTETIKTETQQKAAKAEPAKTSTTEKAAKTTTAKKTAAKRTSAKKDIKVKAIVEYYGKQVEEKDMIASVKKAWTKSGRKVGEIKTIDLYIKPEEGAVYYVINGIDTGAVAF